MFKRPPYLPLIISLALASVAAAPAMATDEVPAPPAPPAQSAPATGGPAACKDSSRPSSRITTSAAGAARKRTVRGTASDRGCGVSGRGTVTHVRISVSRKRGAKCQYMSSRGRLGRAKSCASTTWLAAHGTDSWSFALPKRLGRGTFTIHAQAVDSAGNVGLQRSQHVRLK